MVTLYICKVLTYIFLFTMVFGGATVSIGTVVFAAGNMRQSHSQNPMGNETPTDASYSVLECVSYTKKSSTTGMMTTVSTLSVTELTEYGLFSQTNSTADTPLTSMQSSTGDYVKCLVLPRGWPTDKTHDDECLKPDDGEVQIGDVHYTQMCDTVGIQWTWCLFLLIVTPYGFVFFRCLWLVMFRQKKWPSVDALIVVSCPQLLID